MSVTSDDTDLLLLVPPDLFAVHDDKTHAWVIAAEQKSSILPMENFGGSHSSVRRCESAENLTPISKLSLRSRSLHSTPSKFSSPHRNLLTSESYLSQKLRDDQTLREIDRYFELKSLSREELHHDVVEKFDLSDVRQLLANIDEKQKEISLKVGCAESNSSRSDDLKRSGVCRSINFEENDKCHQQASVMESISIQTDESSKSKSDVLTLHSLWSNNINKSTLFEEQSILKQRLEEERCRRQHCEDLIRNLQMKLLENEEKLAVALKVDEEKDFAIKKLKDGWSKLVAQWEALNSRNSELSKQLEDERLQFEEQKSTAAASVKRYEVELSKALDLAHGYKEKCEAAVNEQKAAIRNSDLVRLELSSIQGNIQDLEDTNSRLNSDLTLKNDLLNESKRKIGELATNIKDLKKQIKSLQGDKDRVNKEKCEKDAVKLSLEESRKKEVLLKNELQEVLKEKNDLKQYYQQQVEAIVLEKQKDFQAQLLNAEKSLQIQLESKERSFSEAATRQIQQLTEKHKLEISLLEEKNDEEMRLQRIRLAQCQQKIDDLQKIISVQSSSQNELAGKLHGVMEAQWKETLKIISSTSQSAANGDLPKILRQNTFTKDYESVNLAKVCQGLASSARRPGCETYRINETPQKIVSSEPKLRDFVDRLLQRPCEVDDSLCSSRNDLATNSLACVNENSSSSKEVSKSDKATPPPWR